MREAFARSGLWFFGTIAAIYLFMPNWLEDDSLSEQILKLFLAGLIVGGAMFCKEWYDLERAERFRKEREEARLTEEKTGDE